MNLMDLYLFSTSKYDQVLPFIRSIDIFKLAGGAGVVYMLYKTISIYLIRRKYDHVIGPSTKGYESFSLSLFYFLNINFNIF